MEFYSINPFDGSEVGRYTAHTAAEVQTKLELTAQAFSGWRARPLSQRAALMARAGNVLRKNTEAFARRITLEMGKPIAESRAEIHKCAWVCDYYAEHAAAFLADEPIGTGAQRSFVRHDPIGCVLAVMPWNFPFWQVFRFAAPVLTVGNTTLLKHAPNVLGCAALIEAVFEEAGFPEGVFQHLRIHHDQVAALLAHDVVKAVSLTGSERAGAAVAELAGRQIKPALLELGGNNAFIVWEDADLAAAVDIAVTARMLNCGQSCIAAKRFILVGNTYEAFVARFTQAVQSLKTGDPMEENTQLGPLARPDLAEQLNRQVRESVEQGATLLLGGQHRGCFHEPTILGEVRPGMPAFEEETFGPLAAMIRARDIDEAFDLAARSRLGLGLTLCTTDIDKALSMADRVADGAYFINELVKSDPRLPFGGTKRSGYGRELARDGILAFVNRKTVYVR